MFKNLFGKVFFITLSFFISLSFTFAQPPRRDDNRVRTVTVPFSIFTKEELKKNRIGEIVEAGDLIVTEDGEQQVILSIRSTAENPLELAILVQDDLSSSVNLELNRLADFIRHLPRGSRVMVAYIRGGTIQVRQKFTDDLDQAASSLRIVISNSSFGGNPYEGVREATKRFDALPAGRRALLLISDGLDISRGLDDLYSLQNLALEQAILNAQRRSIAVYSFYTTGSLTENPTSRFNLIGQSLLSKLSDETGGRAFFQGTQAPVSFEPFLKDLGITLTRQFALTYLSTHMKKGFHKVKITSTNPQIKIEHPDGYFYR